MTIQNNVERILRTILNQERFVTEVIAMDFDRDKVDEMTLALLYLVMWQREEGLGARAWKSFDWDTMNRLHEKDLISDPKKKAKSVCVTEEGFTLAKAAFLKHFGKKET